MNLVLAYDVLGKWNRQMKLTYFVIHIVTSRF